MQGPCLIEVIPPIGTQQSRGLPGTWSLEKDILHLATGSFGTLALPISEISGFSLDGPVLTLFLKQRKVLLARMGGGAETLLDLLERRWPILRSEALRLTGRGEPRSYACVFGDLDSLAQPGRAVVFDDLLLVFQTGQDLSPIFLPLVENVLLDEEAYALALKGWDGWTFTFSRLGPRLEEFAERVTRGRAALSAEASTLLRACLPSLDAFALMAVSSAWLPGRLISLEELSTLSSDLPGALRALVAGLPRRREAEALHHGLSHRDVYFALAPPSAAAPEPEEAPLGPDGDACTPADGQPPPALLWMAVRRGGHWILEALSEGDRATYAFEAGDEGPKLLSMVLCAPQFSREALYLPMDRLTGERAPLAAAARELPFLRDLRARLKARALHTSFEAWKKSLAI
ncbi:MAG: hypothetical protein AB1347_00375 [Acidobacteriota bacterium]